MCGIAGIVYKDKKMHNIGNDMTNMLNALQHRGPDSAGFALYGGLGLPDGEYILNIQIDDDNQISDVKNIIQNDSSIAQEEKIPSVDDTIIYRCHVNLDNFKQLKPLITKVDQIDDVIVLNGSHSFEMIKDVGSVLE